MTASAPPAPVTRRPLWPVWLAGLSLAGGLLTPALGGAWGYLFLRLVLDYDNALHSGLPWLVPLSDAGSVLLVLLPIVALAAGGLAFVRLR